MKKSVLASIAFCLMAVTGFAQQIPFQGKLLENGSPVNGPKDFTFSIDVDGNIWTEDHLGVSVSDGLYSVVLGSITPLPDDLFKSVDSRSMDISIGGTPISPIDVFAPSTSYYFSHNDGAVSRPAILAELSGNVAGWAAIEGVSTVEGNAYGVYGFAGTTVDGESAGVYGYGQGAGKTNMGVQGIARGAGNGDDFNAPGGGSYNNGVLGWARDNTFGNAGVFGLAHGTDGVDNLGVVGWSEVMNGGENKGVLGWAKGDGINKGVVGMATGGTENWAGWFDGDVMISGSLVSSGANPLQVNNGAGDLRAEIGLFNDGGSIKAYGSGGLNAAILGTRASNDAQGFLGLYNTAGVAGINMKVEGGPGTEYGSLLTMGPNTPNIQLLGKNWDDPDLPAIYLFGQHTNGSTWYKTNVLLEVHSDGTNNWGKLTLENGIEGASPQEPTVQLDGFDGSLTLRSPDGSQEFRIDPSGLGGGSAVNASTLNNEAVAIGKKDPGWDPGNAGFIHMYGDTPVDKDNIRVAIETSNDVNGDATGSLSLFGPVFNDPGCTSCPKNFVNLGIGNDSGGGDPSGWAGSMDLMGTNSPNISMGSKLWENADLPLITLFGNRPDGGGWFYNHMELTVNQDGPQQWGEINLLANDGVPNFTFGAKSWETAGRPYMAMRGSIEVDDGAGNFYYPDLVYMDVQDDGAGNEIGVLHLRSTDGTDFRLDPNGLGAAGTSFPNLEIENELTDPGTPAITMGVTQDTGGNDPTGYSGWIGVNGKNGPNITLSSMSNENHDLPSFNMAGSIVHPTEGWTYSSLDMWVERDNGTGEEAAKFHMMANEGISNIEMGGKTWEPGGGGLPYMAMRGVQGPDLVWMEGVDDGAGNEIGSLSFMSTNGASFGINAYGFTGDISDFRAKNMIAVSETSNPANNVIEMFESGDAGYMNVNNSANENTISFDGENGSIGVSMNNGGGMAQYSSMSVASGGPGGAVFGNITLSDDLGNITTIEGFGEMSLSASSNSGIRMYGDFNQNDANGNRAHLAVDHANGNDHVWIWGTGDIDATGNATIVGDINSNSYSLNSGTAIISSENFGNGDFGKINLAGAAAGSNIDLEFGGTGNEEPRISLSQNNSFKVNIQVGANSGNILLRDALDANTISLDGNMGRIDVTGSVYASGVQLTSDRRLKTDINQLSGSLDNILQLRGVSYKWLDTAKSQNRQIGVIAQEVEEIYPEFVDTKDDGMKSVNYSQMVAVLIEAVKELNAKIEALETENTELKASLGKVESNNEQLKSMQSQIESLQLMFEKLTEPGVQNVQVTGDKE